ncbi:MAG TPA: SDR family oxidoreductase [Thermoanaerobaculia bacterium]|nr:SDR family oxidoreductase [Thermoanaerobaculia bacterium]
MVTGASAGVGRAVVRELGRRGARIGLLARGRDGLEAAAREVERLGGTALVLVADVADHDQVERAAAEVERTLGPIDLWINNAMASVFSPVRELRPEEVRRVTEVTYLGVVHGTMAALRRMLPRDRGIIVQVGSALAYRGIPLQAAYCAAKHAIQGFNDSLYSELLHDGSRVRLTMVNLPAINTPQFDWVLSRLPRRARPVPPIYQPELAARAILWAAEHPRRELNLGWPTTLAIVGNNLFPFLGDLHLARNGYESQQTDEPEDPARPHNLWDPLPGDHGAHGRFDASATPRSLHFLLSINRGALLAGAAAILGGAALLGLARKGRRRGKRRRKRRTSE